MRTGSYGSKRRPIGKSNRFGSCWEKALLSSAAAALKEWNEKENAITAAALRNSSFYD